MIFLGMFFILCIIYFDFKQKQNIFSPVLLFSSLFFFILLMAMLRLNGLKEFSDTSVYSIIIGVISFFIGDRLVCKFGEKKFFLQTKKIIDDNSLDLKVNWFFLKILLVIVTFGISLVLINAFYMLINGTEYSQIRGVMLGYIDGESLIANRYLDVVVNYFSSPGLYALVPFAIYFFIRRQHHKFTLMVFVLLILNVVATGGRIILVYTVIQFLATLAFNYLEITEKMKKLIIFIVPSIIIVILVLSSLRTSGSVYEVIYAYFSAPVVLLSEWQKAVSEANMWSYGFSFFYPITYVLNAFFNLMGLNIEFLNNVVSWQGAPQHIWMEVFPGWSMNAFATLFYFFYQDFRFLGIIIYSIIYGGLSSFVFHKAFVEKKACYFIIYLVIIRSIIGSFMIWQLGSTVFFVSFLMMLGCFEFNNKIILGRNK